MMLDMIELYYFSPTGGTKKTGEIFCEAIARKVKTVNLGLYGKAAEEPAIWLGFELIDLV